MSNWRAPCWARRCRKKTRENGKDENEWEDFENAVLSILAGHSSGGYIFVCRAPEPRRHYFLARARYGCGRHHRRYLRRASYQRLGRYYRCRRILVRPHRRPEPHFRWGQHLDGDGALHLCGKLSLRSRYLRAAPQPSRADARSRGPGQQRIYSCDQRRFGGPGPHNLRCRARRAARIHRGVVRCAGRQPVGSDREPHRIHSYQWRRYNPRLGHSGTGIGHFSRIDVARGRRGPALSQDYPASAPRA